MQHFQKGTATGRFGRVDRHRQSWASLSPTSGQETETSCAAMGFMRLANYFNGEQSDGYAATAHRLMDAQIEVAFDRVSEDVEGLLGQATYHATKSHLTEQYTPFGDYFFLETLTWLGDNRIDFWSRPDTINKSERNN
jgi:hypothetical protein